MRSSVPLAYRKTFTHRHTVVQGIISHQELNFDSLTDSTKKTKNYQAKPSHFFQKNSRKGTEAQRTLLNKIALRPLQYFLVFLVIINMKYALNLLSTPNPSRLGVLARINLGKGIVLVVKIIL
jgi:hypothetical protein